MRYLTKRLDKLNVVHDLPRDQSRIYFGAWVGLEDQAGDDSWVRLVGYDEIDPARRWISIDSPLARALLGKGVGDKVSYDTSAGTRSALILTISYREPVAESS